MKNIMYADLDDMLFEDRERRYGAYFLRKHASKTVAIALALVVSSTGIAVAMPYILGKLHPPTTATQRDVNVILMDIPAPPKEEAKAEPLPPPPPPPKPKLDAAMMSARIPDPKPEDDVKEEEIIHENEDLNKATNIGLKDVDGENRRDEFSEIDGDGDIPDVLQEEKREEEPKFDDVIFGVEDPRPVNMADIQKLVGYPAVAREAGIEGDVVVRILIDERGNYMKHKVIKQMHPILSKAVEERISMLKFTPAIQGNKPVKFWVNVPFRFKLAK